MISELSFLIELLLKHKLEDSTKDLLAKRIGDVEERLSQPMAIALRPPVPVPLSVAIQSPSTQAAMMRHGPVEAPPVPIEAVAQTPATIAALANRNAAIQSAISGKPEKGRNSPRKF